MKHLLLSLCTFCMVFTSHAQKKESAKVQMALTKFKDFNKDIPKYEVMLMGVFHTDYPTKDKFMTNKENQLDILAPQRQKELDDLVNELAKSKPTKIFVEWPIGLQSRVDTLYREYLEGKYQDEPSEIFQVGMRLAKKLGHSKIYLSDANGASYTVPAADSISFFNKVNSLRIPEIEKIFEASEKKIRWLEDYQKQLTISEIFTLYNTSSFIDTDMVATYFDTDLEPFGSDQFPTYWHNRNIRIFSNIKRHLEPNDRAFVMFGASHIPILKHLFEHSLQFKVSQFGLDF
ncbi:DUF5694 domain-containing protein [Lacihabitans lacunae]|uniref:DUF5694 domain-containing protein n=1 Tax=Lacihabitans lacunae TaxID=1028214 RepID=A0ABV7YZX4_9BACT